jgi:hypothetical protein
MVSGMAKASILDEERRTEFFGRKNGSRFSRVIII